MSWLMLLLGALAGAIIAAVAFAATLQAKMVVSHKAKGTFEEVCNRLEEAVAGPDANGWGIPFAAWNFYQSQIEKDFKLDNLKECRIYPVCKSAYANEVVREQPHWAGIMPCSWAIYQTKDGQVYISKMNIGLMSMMMTGLIGRVMKKVSQEEHVLLERVLKGETIPLKQALDES